MKTLEDRVAIVTGGAMGVGRGIAEVLAQEGARVAISDLSAEAGARTAHELEQRGLEVASFQTDVVDRGSVDACVQNVLDRWGRIDIVVANAGIYPIKALEELTDTEWDRVMDINVKGAVHAIQASVPAMRSRGYGRIVLTSSITGPIVGAAKLGHYAASKAALLGLMRSAALEFVRDGITVNAVQPGNVRTEGIVNFGEEFIAEMVKSIPVGRLAEPAEVGWAVRFLASEEAAYITGQTIVIDGGQVLPEGGIEASD
jgi:3-oxoacyl-[acyl-carrier protein] reductase